MARLSPEAFAGIEQTINENIMGQAPISLRSTFDVGASLDGIANRLTLSRDSIDTNPGLNQ